MAFTFERQTDIDRPGVPGSADLDLSVVMPIYNEAGVIARVVTSWLEMLEQLNLNYELLDR